MFRNVDIIICVKAINTGLPYICDFKAIRVNPLGARAVRKKMCHLETLDPTFFLGPYPFSDPKLVK